MDGLQGKSHLEINDDRGSPYFRTFPHAYKWQNWTEPSMPGPPGLRFRFATPESLDTSKVQNHGAGKPRGKSSESNLIRLLLIGNPADFFWPKVIASFCLSLRLWALWIPSPFGSCLEFGHVWTPRHFPKSFPPQKKNRIFPHVLYTQGTSFSQRRSKEKVRIGCMMVLEALRLVLKDGGKKRVLWG